jgi:hypothetical protein
MAGWLLFFIRGEESPSFIRAECPLMAGRGDSTESATETYRLLMNYL